MPHTDEGLALYNIIAHGAGELASDSRRNLDGAGEYRGLDAALL
jgi:hypothetical protein